MRSARVFDDLNVGVASAGLPSPASVNCPACTAARVSALTAARERVADDTMVMVAHLSIALFAELLQQAG